MGLVPGVLGGGETREGERDAGGYDALRSRGEVSESREGGGGRRTEKR